MDEGAAPGPVCGEAGNGAGSGRKGEESMRHPRENEVTVGLVNNEAMFCSRASVAKEASRL